MREILLKELIDSCPKLWGSNIGLLNIVLEDDQQVHYDWKKGELSFYDRRIETRSNQTAPSGNYNELKEYNKLAAEMDKLREENRRLRISFHDAGLQLYDLNKKYQYEIAARKIGELTSLSELRVKEESEHNAGLTRMQKFGVPKIEKVIFSDPATIVFWKDGTKTVVKAHNEPFDAEKGLAMAISKKALGNDRGYFDTFKRWSGKWQQGVDYLRKLHVKANAKTPLETLADKCSEALNNLSDSLTKGGTE